MWSSENEIWILEVLERCVLHYSYNLLYLADKNKTYLLAMLLHILDKQSIPAYSPSNF
jgi:hypothetical protein